MGLRASHPFLAEYDRSFTVEHEGRAIRSNVQLFPDTGGHALVNLYRVGSAVLLQTMGHEEYRIDLNSGSGTVRPTAFDEAVPRRPLEATFLGAFDFDEHDLWQFMPAATRRERPIGAIR